MVGLPHDVDDYYICRRLKLKGETENMGVCTKERKGDTAEVLMDSLRREVTETSGLHTPKD